MSSDRSSGGSSYLRAGCRSTPLTSVHFRPHSAEAGLGGLRVLTDSLPFKGVVWRRGSMRRIRRLLLAGSVVLASAPMVGAVQTAHAGAQQTYLVVYKQQSLPAGVAETISRAGGTVVATYSAIGVAVVRSDSTTFSGSLMKDASVEGVSSTAGLATRINNGALGDTSTSVDNSTPAPGDDTLSSLQWDMIMIHAPEARAINGGSSSVTVGDIDTGLDYTHPDLAANVDFAKSAGCVGHAADTARALGEVDVGSQVRVRVVEAGVDVTDRYRGASPIDGPSLRGVDHDHVPLEARQRVVARSRSRVVDCR